MKKIVVAVTGASGSIYAKRLIIKLKEIENQIADCGIVFSDTAKEIWNYELNEEINTFNFKQYSNNNFYAPFASGSANYDALIICPCSMGMLGRIANGISDDLISRTADVMLKERKKLILVIRETPYNLLHINNMKALTEAGVIICPATPSFYSKPVTIEQLVDTVVDRVIQLVGLEIETFRWKYDNEQ